jgi:hypothetical protein
VTFAVAMSVSLLVAVSPHGQDEAHHEAPPLPAAWGLPVVGAAGAVVGGVGGAGAALAVALVAKEATGEEVSPASQGLNRFATFASLVAPALVSVGGAVAGAHWVAGLPGALTVGFGATMGAAIGTGAALAVVPVGASAATLPGAELGSIAAIGGIVVGAAALGAALAGIVAGLTLDPALLDDTDVEAEVAATSGLTRGANTGRSSPHLAAAGITQW